MGKPKNLSKRQLAVIEDLFAGELDEQAILTKHKVSRNLYHKWLADDRFAEQFNEHIGRAYRQSQLILARYAPLAAAKLVSLTESDKDETARKACLDIVSQVANRELPMANRQSRSDQRYTTSDTREALSAETASRLLAALAEQQQSDS